MADRPHDTAGDQEQRFLTAFDEYNDALFRHAVLRVSDREKAIDLVHDTFTKVWLYVREGYQIEQFRPFLYKVLNNLIIDTYRKTKEQSLDALMAQEGVDEGSFEGLQGNETESLINTLDGERAFLLLAELPDQYKEVITLRFVDGLGPKEIAELVEETENVISVRLHRALAALKKRIVAHEETADARRRHT